MNPLKTSILSSIKTIKKDDWNACCYSDGGEKNPFLSYEFFRLLETSGSIGKGTGWQPFYILFFENDLLIGILPSFLKSHSQGEYVFDHGWAEAYHRAGGNYYPKLQVAVPFTPVTGERIFIRSGYKEKNIDNILSITKDIIVEKGISSLHISFCERALAEKASANQILTREGIQYHWHNKNYSSFNKFLDSLSSRKRKNIKKERKQAHAFGGKILQSVGKDITPEQMEAFWFFYQNTGDRKWGIPYLTKDFFMNLKNEMSDKILLILAEKDNEYVAGALNFIGGKALYGRYWGCKNYYPSMHFEVCYYQAIDFAIKNGLNRVEAGAQGDHKIARGYLPSITYSSHWFSHSGFLAAVDNFLQEEKKMIRTHGDELEFLSPFKKGENLNDKKIQ
jgi:predicted N-acyltransferase